MAKIGRVLQKIFASGANNNGVIGSLQNGTRIDSNDLSVIQGLAAWAAGLNSVVVGGQQVIPLEELQSLSYVATTQLAYLFQEGIAEYEVGTTYFTNSIVKKPNTYQIYGSVTDNNTGNALTDTTKWQFLQDLANPSVSFLWCGVATGSSNALTLTPATAITAYKTGQPIEFIPATNNAAGTVSVAISGLGNRNLAIGTNTTLPANTIKAGKMIFAVDDGTNIQIVDTPAFLHGSDVASASTIDVTATVGKIVDVTGTTNIANITIDEGSLRILRFVNALTLQTTGNITLPTGANIVTAAGDYAIVMGYAAGVVRMMYFRADGSALYVPKASAAEVKAAAIDTKFVTPLQMVNHPGIAKAWVTFVGNTAVILAQYNIASIARNGTGDYSISFTNAMADANYAVDFGVQDNISSNNLWNGSIYLTKTTAGFRFLFKSGQSGSLTDPTPQGMLIIHGN